LLLLLSKKQLYISWSILLIIIIVVVNYISIFEKYKIILLSCSITIIYITSN